ncbi:hypothetical protein [Phyllobacterium endophyticum]|nr:hypothetical protein [Phyllobacterium endophyticum]MBB3238049.1 hypothetical protein [Phyllobacterium endophyticum]TYR42640.1 hypothetical protein FY050_15780 [Phyllobacterium endophyticum]
MMSYFNDEQSYQTRKTAWGLMNLAELTFMTADEAKPYFKTFLLPAGMKADPTKGQLELSGEFAGWKQIGGDAPGFNAGNGAITRDQKQHVLDALHITAANLSALGLDNSYLGDNGQPIASDLTQPIDNRGFFRGFNAVGDTAGSIIRRISPEGGTQVQVLARYDHDGAITDLAMIALGTNRAADLAEIDGEANMSVALGLNYLMKAVRSVAQPSISPDHIIFAGYSLGGAITNSIEYHVKDLADGFFKDAHFVGFDASSISPNASDKNLLNFGAENDPVYGLFSHETNLPPSDDFKQIFGRIIPMLKKELPKVSDAERAKIFDGDSKKENIGKLVDEGGLSATFSALAHLRTDTTFKGIGFVGTAIALLIKSVFTGVFPGLMADAFREMLDISRYGETDKTVIAQYNKNLENIVTKYRNIFDNIKPYVTSGNNNLVILIIPTMKIGRLLEFLSTMKVFLASDGSRMV